MKLSSLIFLAVVLGLTIWVLIISTQSMNTAVTNIECCNGTACSDTYYTQQDNLCHLSLCENSPTSLLNKSTCVYEGANISLNISN